MQTILGANGQIAVELARELHRAYTEELRLVSRNPRKVSESDVVISADLLDASQTAAAVEGSDIVYFTAGLPAKTELWEAQFPTMLRNALDAARDSATTVLINAVPKDKAILDIGPASIEALLPFIKKAKTILWNGTLGRCETGYSDATHMLAQAIIESKAYSVIGGGDTEAALESLGLSKKFSFVSTGGGAMLDFLAYGTLPGLEVLNKNYKKED